MSTVKTTKAGKLFRRSTAVISSAVMATSVAAMYASAGFEYEQAGNSDSLMRKMIGILLTITRYVGVALVVYGVYEIVMSFMQNQPEAKTKGIVMALAGAAMTTIKSIVNGLGLLSGD